MSNCIGCINESKKGLICSECSRNYVDKFIYKDKIITRYVIMKGNIFINAYHSMSLAKNEIKDSNHRIVKLVEIR